MVFSLFSAFTAASFFESGFCGGFLGVSPVGPITIEFDAGRACFFCLDFFRAYVSAMMCSRRICPRSQVQNSRRRRMT